MLSNILAAIAVPLIFPLVEPHTDVTFGIAFLKILSKVFPLLLAPFFIALLFRYYIPRLHKFLLKYHTSAFYLWAVALTIVMGQTTRSLVNSTADAQRLGLNFTKSVESVFKRGGRPKFSKASPETQANWAKTIYMPTMTAEELVESGKFVWDVNRLILHPDFEAELYRNYPQQSIEDGLLTTVSFK